jgi:hypothetical protein
MVALIVICNIMAKIWGLSSSYTFIFSLCLLPFIVRKGIVVCDGHWEFRIQKPKEKEGKFPKEVHLCLCPSWLRVLQKCETMEFGVYNMCIE